MKLKLWEVLKFWLKVGVIWGVTVAIVCFASYFKEFSVEDALFIVGAIYMLLGGVSSLGSFGRRTDIQYLHTRSIGYKSSVEETQTDHLEVERNGSFMMKMAIVGVLLLVSSYYL